jgi:hypothetical protein
MMIAARNDGAEDVESVPMFDVRQRAAGEHLG